MRSPCFANETIDKQPQTQAASVVEEYEAEPTADTVIDGHGDEGQERKPT
jgi:hypothetical protein